MNAKTIVQSPMVTAATWLALGAYLFFWFDRPYLSYPLMPAPVLSTNITPGSLVRLSIRRCNIRDRPQIYDVVRDLVRVDGPNKGARSQLISSKSRVDPGCWTSISPPVEIPKDTQPGRYYIDGYAQVDGYVRNHQLPWRSDDFDVVRP